MRSLRIASRAVAPFAVLHSLVFLALASPAPLLGQAPAPDAPPYELRRALLEATRWEPVVVAIPSDDQRSVFYNPRAVDATALQVIVQPPEEVTAVPEAIFRISSWLVPEGDLSDRLGDVVGHAGDQVSRGNRTVAHLHDEIRISFVVEGSPRAGDQFLLYRRDRQIELVGDILIPTGRVLVTGLDGEFAIGLVVEEYARIEVGDHVGRLPTFLLRPGVHPQPSNLGVRGTILAFEEVRELYLPGQMAFIDVGRPQGIAVGDEFLAYAGETGDTGAAAIARFQVVNTGETHSTLRVLDVTAPHLIRTGLEVVLDRKMP